ncbi:heavy metal-associated isoprenylated plant protein 8-like [Salvia miltiorrhiza]|uniref:heavy metal-associated isoprenylated plant protein 8-like n=1 Tax=Salvia miltiorrhiza TaxID=226208 RepID=UPI0025ABE80E|nr:heavy metal-associated isoprenylated plant protein 8-like [Salvia miltiorrhiza]
MSSAEAQNENEKTTQNENENEKMNPKGIIVLGVYIHCEGCANEVLKYLRGFQGVEGVEIDVKNNKVTVKGEKADPIKVSERLKKKSGKHVELISPIPRKQDQNKHPKKPQADLFDVVLKIYIHCEGCAKEVKHCILKMDGVQTVDPDAAKNTVVVKGSMEPKKLVEFINKRGGRHAEILKQTKLNKKGDEKHAENPKESKQTKKNNNAQNSDQNALNSHRLVFAPQLFSDENPNSCSLM